MFTAKTILLIPAMMGLSVFAFAQKAYEAVYYRGVIQHKTLEFTLAHGYMAGCTLSVKDSKTKRKGLFLPEEGFADDHKEMKFYHFTASGKTLDDYFILEHMEDEYEKVPAKISGRYYYKSTTKPVTLWLKRTGPARTRISSPQAIKNK